MRMRWLAACDAPVGELACPERVAAPAPPVEEKPALNSPVQAKPGWQTELQRQRVNADKSAEYRYMRPRGNEPWRSFVEAFNEMNPLLYITTAVTGLLC